jgi:hypothetical protein
MAEDLTTRTCKIDAFLGFPPEPQELRAQRIGHVLVNTATDRPWSQYFCCMLAGIAEMGLVKSTPQKIIADGTDWRFLNELKRELKA